MPEEILPDPAPLVVFFMPNFLGIAFAVGLEKIGMETKLGSLVKSLSSTFGAETSVHPYAFMGLGVFCLFMMNSFLAGRVVLARIECNVKLPNLYASKSGKGNSAERATAFNTIQRGHQNFLEQLPQLVLSVLVMNTIVERPNTCGLVLLLVCIGRITYAYGYCYDISSRTAGVLLAMFAQAVGVGYAALAALTLVGIRLVDL